LPVRVMRPRRCFSPLESSPGTSQYKPSTLWATGTAENHATRPAST
jgi:hypothetical protein